MRTPIITFVLGAVAVFVVEHVALPHHSSVIGQAVAETVKPAPDTGCEVFENPTLNALGGWASRMGSKGYKVTALTAAPSPMGGGATFVAVACR